MPAASTLPVHLACRGIFEPRGVGEVHVAEGGVPIGYLKPRPVILHDRRFSPNNANVQWDGSTDTPSFFSVGVDKTLRKAVVVLHILPVGEAAADRIREWIRGMTKGRFPRLRECFLRSFCFPRLPAFYRLRRRFL